MLYIQTWTKKSNVLPGKELFTCMCVYCCIKIDLIYKHRMYILHSVLNMEGSIKKHRLYSRQKSTQVNLKQILKKVRYPAIFLGAFYTIVGIFIPQHLVGPLFPTNTSNMSKSSQNHHPDIKTSLYTNHLIPLLATATAALPGVQQNTSCRPQPLPK